MTTAHFHPLTVRDVRRETSECVSLGLDVPPALAERLAPGHRVLVPLRSRKVTAGGPETGEKPGTGPPQAVAELMGARPLFENRHPREFEVLRT